jgi:hypothetical protein
MGLPYTPFRNTERAQILKDKVRYNPLAIKIELSSHD